MNPDDTWVGKARAKINLRLRVLEREASGYHRLDTVFQALELADDVALAWSGGSQDSIDVSGVPKGALGPVEKNLAVLAAARFRVAADESGKAVPGVHITLKKAIPHGAGLGGGSSDAAAVLRGMNELSGRLFGRSELSALGAELGSDVPFFVSDLARARGTGHGDRITPLPELPTRPVLLLLPSAPVSTAWAYSVMAEDRAGVDPSAITVGGADAVARDWPTTVTHARNDFEEALFLRRPELALVRDALLQAGAELAMLSGSGSALFGVFGSEADLTTATRVLEGAPSQAWVRAIRTFTAE